jgi:D-amino-acid dehydrogenase
MKVIVLGAGIIGVSTAWYLRQAGCEVMVIERQPAAALETSFANGAQISVSHAEPWANPRAPWLLMKWLGREDAPLLFRLRPELRQWLWGLAFLRECSPARVRYNVKNIVALATYSRSQLQQLRTQLGLDYDHLTRGILHFYLDPEEFKHAQEAAALMREFGCNRRSISAEEVLRIEPALHSIRAQIVGGDYTAEDESGDIFKFTQSLALQAEKAGVSFLYSSQVTRLLPQPRSLGRPSRIQGVEVIANDGHYQQWQADAYVVALGSYSTDLVAPVGVKALIYPAKGYSATFDIVRADAAPTVSLTDDEYKIVFSRLGDRLRVAGTAELNGYSRELNPLRCAALTRRAQALFPEACDYQYPQYWAGLRPATPSNLPLIGKTRIDNLYLNTGHGTLGWTMGVGSGAALADLMTGKTPGVKFAFL